MEAQEPVYGYMDYPCVLTVGDYPDDPYTSESHTYYQMYNDLDMACFYKAEDNYEICYAYFRNGEEGNAWQFASNEVEAWIWTDCEEYDASFQWGCYAGEWDASPSDFEYDTSDWDMDDSWMDDYDEC